MTSAELMNWMAYERTYGSILPHERVDVGFAQLQWLMVQLWTKQKRKLTVADFMPHWFQELTQRGARKPEAVLQGFEALMAMAEKGES
jgi:hypothetical protein